MEKENIFSGKKIICFQDPAMDQWTTIQSLNQTAQYLREYSQNIESLFFFLISIILGIVTTYFLSIKNWILMLVTLIVLQLFLLWRLNKLRKYQKELFTIFEENKEHARKLGIKIPGDKQTSKKKGDE